MLDLNAVGSSCSFLQFYNMPTDTTGSDWTVSVNIISMLVGL